MKMNVVGLIAALLALGTTQNPVQSQSAQDVLHSNPLGNGAVAQNSASPTGTTPATLPDNRGLFMSVITNYTRITNQVIVTNYVVTTNLTFTTNYYNSQGQLLTLVQTPNATAALADAKPNPPPPAAPDPGIIRSNRLQALKDLLSLGLASVSNSLSVPGSFANNPNIQIHIPEGVTVLDRKKGQTLTTAMNTTAEKAAPGACAIIQKSILQLDTPDPAQVLQGTNDAATRLLVTSQGQDISNQILALVTAAAADARVPDAYHAVMLRGGGLLGAVLGTAPSVDINAHITRGLVDAIFLNLSTQENSIRSDPSKRKTKALQDAFAK